MILVGAFLLRALDNYESVILGLTENFLEVLNLYLERVTKFVVLLVFFKINSVNDICKIIQVRRLKITILLEFQVYLL